MAKLNLKLLALSIAAGGLALPAPAVAYHAHQVAPVALIAAFDQTLGYDDDDDDYRRSRWERRDRYDRRYSRSRAQAYRPYAEPVYRDTRVWRGDDGRYYCRKSDGTTGLVIGGAAGALLGRELAGRGDRTLGAILGAAGGALLGKKIDSGLRCN